MTCPARTFFLIWLALMAGVLALGVFIAQVSAEPSYTVNYQGKLSDNTGLTVANGTYTMVFKLYTAPTGGAAIWTETRSAGNKVTVTNGLFSVMLGSITSLASVNFNQPLYLGVTIEADAEMTPRKIIGSVPSAFEAKKVGGVASSSFLRSDEADSASGLLTFTGGLISNSSTTIRNLSTTNATTTSLYLGGDRITDFTGSNLTVTANALGLSSTYAGQTSITTLGTIGSGTWQGAAISSTYLDTAVILSTEIDTSSELAALLGDETGTGNVVFSASPTFTGTTNLASFIASGSSTISRATFTTATTTNLVVNGERFTDLTGSGLALSSNALTVSLGNDFITPNNIKTSGQTDEYCLTYESSGTTWEWQTCGAGGSATLLGLTDVPDSYIDQAVFFSSGGQTFFDTDFKFSSSTNRLTVGTATFGTTGFSFAGAATTTLANNNPYAFTFATSSTARPLFRIDTTSGGESVQIGAVGGDVYIGAVGNGSDLIFEESSIISGQGGNRLTLGVAGDLINFGTGINVGFGTTTPNQAIGIFRSAADSAIEFSSLTGSPYKWSMGIDYSDAGKFKISSSSALGTNDRFVINGAGRVGIATSSPWQELSVTGDFALTGRIYDSLASAGTNGMILQTTGSATRWVATSSLNLGASALAADSLDFTELQDTLDLDANTNINADNDASQFGLTVTSDLSVAARSAALLTLTQASNVTNDFDGTGTGMFNITNSDVGSDTALIYLDQNSTVSDATAIRIDTPAANTYGLDITVGAGIGARLNTITSGRGFDVALASGITSGSVLNVSGGSSGSISAFTGDYILAAPTRSYGGGGTLSDTGSFLDFTRSHTVTAASTYNITGDLATLSSSLTETSGTITDSSNILSLAQNCGTNADCTGTVLELTNAGTGNGADIFLTNTAGTQTNGMYIRRNGAGGTTSNGLNIASDAGTLTTALLIADGAGTIGTGIQLTGTFSTNLLDTPNVDISAAGLITGATGIVSSGSSTLARASFVTATTTNLVVNGERFNDLTGTGLVFSANTLTASLGTNIAAAEIADGDHGFFTYTTGVAALDTGGLTSANLFGALTNETGSGAGTPLAVFSESPTIVTPTFTTSATVPLIYGGTGAGSSLSLQSTSGNGTSDFIRFLVGNAGATEAGRFTTAGRMGLGTTTPNQKLSIFANGADAAIEFSTISGANEKWTVGIDDSDGAKFKISSSSALGTNDRFVIDGSGRIGVGTASPQAKVDVTSGGTYGTRINEGSVDLTVTGDDSWKITMGVANYGTDADYFKIYVGGNPVYPIISSASRFNATASLWGGGNRALTTDVNGKVGIGTTTPNQQLTIFKSAADAAIEFSTVSGTAEKWTIGIDDSDGAKFKISSSSALGTNDRFVIDGAGKVGIGVSSPTQMLDVNGSIKSGNQIILPYSTGSITSNSINWGGNVGFYLASGIQTLLDASNPNFSISVGGTSVFSTGLNQTAQFSLSSGGLKYGIRLNNTASDAAGTATGINFAPGAAGYAKGGLIYTLDSSGFNRGDFAFLQDSAADANGATTTDVVMTIKNNGNVGIGDTTPSSLFTVGNGDLFTINTSGVITSSNNITPNSVLSTGQTDEFCLAYETTGTTFEWQTCGGGMAIGGSITSATQGSVLFAGAAGVLAQDNASFYFNDTTNRLGLGTTTPNEVLTVQGNINLSAATGAIYFDDTKYIYASSTNDSLVFGESAGAALTTTGLNNIAFGYQAMQVATTTDNQTALGYQALKALITSGASVENTAIGYQALTANTYGGRNTAVGFQTLDANTTGSYNSAFGDAAMGANTTGSNNSIYGYQALLTATSTSNAVAFGYQALANLVSSLNSAENTAIGYRALLSTTYGGRNTAVGYNSMDANTTGSYNLALGGDSLGANLTGSNNIALGHNAFGLATSTSNTVAIGYQALDSLISSGASVENTAIGYQALTANTYGGRNTAVGYQTLDANTTGSYNSAFGDGALGGLTIGSNNTALGYQALLNATSSSNNTAIGYHAFLCNSSSCSGSDNTAIGYIALTNNRTGSANVAIGYGSMNSGTSGSNNVAIGWQTLSSSSGSNNTAIGHAAQASGSGGNNTTIGYLALSNGSYTASNNIALGYQAGDNITSGANNIIIGYNIDGISATAANRLNIGNLLFGTGLDGTGTTLSSGNIGIGTSTPNQRLSIFKNGADAAIEFSTVSGTDEKWTIGIDDSDGAKFKISSSSALGTNDRFVINGSGNVGIGTNSPATKLQIEAAGGATIRIQRNDSTQGNGQIQFSGSDAVVDSAISYNDSIAGALTFSTGGASNYRMTIDSSGSVGIGTTTPTSRLDVVNAGSVISTYRSTGATDTRVEYYRTGVREGTISWDNNTFLIGADGGGALQLAAGSVTVGATLNASGDFLVGATSFSGATPKFGVKSTAADWAAQIEANTTSGSSYGVRILGGTNSSDSAFTVNNAANNVTYLNVQGNGFVGIGDASPDYKLDIETDTASGWAATFFNDGNNANRSGILVQAGLDDSTAAGPTTLISFTDGNGDLVGSVSFGSSVTAYNTTSDVRLKTNIVDTAVGIDQLMQVKVRDFNWKADADKSTLTSGFIAQELALVYPQAVTIPKNLNDIWQVDYSKLMPLVIAGVQEQNVTVTEQGVTLGSLGEQLLTTIKSVADLEAAVSSGLSENYRTEDETIEAGELVALATSSDATIRRARTGDDIFGVVSENAGIILGEGMTSSKPVALTGRVKVKVNDEGGDIEIGDAITISTEEGVGTKATTTTRVIGTALEASDDDTDTIHIYVSPQLHYAWNETAAVASLFTPIENDENDTLWGRITTLASNFVDGVLSVTGIKTDELCVGDVCVDEATFLKIVEDAGGTGQSNNNDGNSNDGGEVTPEPEPTEPDLTEPPVYGPEPTEAPPAEVPTPEPEPIVEAPPDPVL